LFFKQTRESLNKTKIITAVNNHQWKDLKDLALFLNKNIVFETKGVDDASDTVSTPILIVLSTPIFIQIAKEYQSEEKLNVDLEYVLNALIEKEEDIDRPDSFGQTALHYAVLNNNLPLVKYLIAKGANPLIENTFQKKPLEYMQHNNENMKEVLEEAIRSVTYKPTLS
jgi:hypothetical protein